MVKNVQEAIKHHLPEFIFGPALKMIEAIFDLLIPLIMKAVIDMSFSTPRDSLTLALSKFILCFGTWVEGNDALNYCLIGGTIILLMSIVGFATTMVTQYIAAKTAVQVGKEVRDSLYGKILSLSKKESEIFGINKLLTILNNDSYQVQQGVLIFIRLAIRAPFIILGAIVFSFILDWQIGFVFLAITPLIIAVVLFIMVRASSKYLVIQSKLDGLSMKSSDDLEGSKVVRAFNRVDYENSRFEESSRDYMDSAIHVGKMNALINPLTFGIVTIAILFVVLLGGFNMQGEGSIQPSTIIAEVSYLDQIFFTTVQLTNVILIFTKSFVSIKRVNSVLAIDPLIVDDEKARSKTIENGEEMIRFDHVSLGYKDGGNYALKDIDFSLKKGESLGIIGGTGSGKSTLIKLIERFFDASEGNLYYKGINIKDYRLSSLRTEIGYVPQKAVLFKGTIRSNMQMAKEDASDDDIKEALDNAMASSFVYQYKDTIDNEVEEGGKNYSGGQRQRLTIARALVKKPELLILDDSTSALDLLTDKKVRQNLIEHYQNLTKILVSQRISTIQDCDLILVLEGGKLIGKGSHSYLMENCPVYKETYESQTRREA